MSARLRRRVVYWITQAVAWTAFVAMISWRADLHGDCGPGSGWLMLATLLSGVASSHVLRAVVLRFHWLDAGLGAELPRLTLGALLIGVVAFLLQAGVHDLLFTDAEPVIGGPL